MIVLLAAIALQEMYVGIWFPIYKDLQDVWRELKSTFKDAITEKNENTRVMYFHGGGKIEFWSMEDPDSGRGRKYHRAIMDEFAKAKKNKQAWQETIRATLTDYKGDAWFLSTPKGNYNYFAQICDQAKELENWSYHHYTSYDNPLIDSREIDEAKNQLDPLTFDQEYLARRVNANDRPYFYMFDRAKHVSKKRLVYNPHLPQWSGFDFNVDPVTNVFAQRPNLFTLQFQKEHQLRDSGTEALCNHLYSQYGARIINPIITGDATGSKRTTNSNRSDWQIIKSKLRVRNDHIKVRNRNLPHSEDRPLCNSILTHATIEIDPSCTHLIEDMENARVDEHGNLIKTSIEGRHFFDISRYIMNAAFPDFVKNPRKYQRHAA